MIAENMLEQELTAPRLHEAFDANGWRRIFLVTGKASYDRGLARSAVEAYCAENGIEVFRFDNFEVNPKEDEMLAGVRAATLFAPDAVIAIGGGSVIDMAKLIRFFCAYTGDIAKADYQAVRLSIPLVAVPTTAGTGSEATHFAVVYRRGRKYSVAHPGVLPDVAWLDYRLSLSASPFQKLCSGLDAFCQAMESLWSCRSTPESRAWAAEALDLLHRSLPQAVKGDHDSMAHMVRGAYLAGRAINISCTTAPHAYSYGLTSLARVPHGLAVAAFLPHFMEHNMRANPGNVNDARGCGFVQERLQEIVEILGLDQAPCRELRVWLDGLVNRFSPAVVLQPTEWQAIVQGVNVERLSNNPVRCEGDGLPVPEKLLSFVSVKG